jgi:hypothetical protein
MVMVRAWTPAGRKAIKGKWILRQSPGDPCVWTGPNASQPCCVQPIFSGGKINVESLILLEARPCAGESDAEMVAGAWDFERINRRYVRHLKILEERPGNALGNVAAAKALLCWSATAREAWLDAVRNDPLLPGRILPSDYLGQQGRWPPAKADGGWKCSGPSTGNYARSNPNSCPANLCCICNKGSPLARAGKTVT